MSRDDGFAIADVDAGLFADPKIVALARRLRNATATAAHVAAYQALVLGSWGAGERITVDDALPAWWLEPIDDIRATLAAVGLIDGEGRIPEHAWRAWFGPAWDRREARRERARKGGLAKPRPHSESASSNAQAKPESVPRQPDRPAGRSVSSVPSRQSDDPQTPASGGQSPRANGTNPRAVAAAMADRQADDARARASRRQQRELASYRGSITEDERRSMNERDAPLAEIPDWAAHLAEIEASGAPTLVQSGQPVDRS